MQLLKASLQLMLGFIAGLLLLEGILHANPRLLLRGMALPVPVDPPIQEKIYDVRFSDADLFYWHSDLIRPIPSEENQIEARVHFYTDELGFPNQAPVDQNVDVVVLGRSYSMGAQVANSWTQLLAEENDLSVLNLSQPGSGIETKNEYFSVFGLRRSPGWVIIEVLPSMDIVGYKPSQRTLLQSLPVPVIQQLVRNYYKKPTSPVEVMPIYPLRIRLQKGSVDMAFFSYYLASLTVDKVSLEKSTQWQEYKHGLARLIENVQSRGICAAILYVPTKENVYFQLAEDPSELKPALTGLSAWKLNDNHQLEQDSQLRVNIDSMRANVSAGRELIADFAEQQSIPLIDPTQVMMDSQLAGDRPFMVYDTHWSAVGHRLVADLVVQTMKTTNCP